MVPRVQLVRLGRPGLESQVVRLGLGGAGRAGGGGGGAAAGAGGRRAGAGQGRLRGPGTADERPTRQPVAPPPSVSPYPPLPDDEPNGRRSGPPGPGQLGPGQPRYGPPRHGGPPPRTARTTRSPTTP